MKNLNILIVLVILLTTMTSASQSYINKQRGWDCRIVATTEFTEFYIDDIEESDTNDSTFNTVGVQFEVVKDIYYVRMGMGFYLNSIAAHYKTDIGAGFNIFQLGPQSRRWNKQKWNRLTSSVRVYGGVAWDDFFDVANNFKIGPELGIDLPAGDKVILGVSTKYLFLSAWDNSSVILTARIGYRF